MVLYYYCPTSRRWFCHSPTHHMVTYEKLADRDKKVHQIWKLTFEVIEIKMQFQKRFQPIVSAEQWEWQLGHKFDACILVLLHSFLRVFCILCSSQPPSSSKVLRKCQKRFFSSSSSYLFRFSIFLIQHIEQLQHCTQPRIITEQWGATKVVFTQENEVARMQTRTRSWQLNNSCSGVSRIKIQYSTDRWCFILVILLQ